MIVNQPGPPFPKKKKIIMFLNYLDFLPFPKKKKKKKKLIVLASQRKRDNYSLNLWFYLTFNYYNQWLYALQFYFVFPADAFGKTLDHFSNLLSSILVKCPC